MKLSIVDYGVGNIKSIQNAFERLSVRPPILTNDKSILEESSGLILPGVGAFDACMTKLHQHKLTEFLTELVVEDKKPILGVCLGMQLMTSSSTEGGYCKGLGWLPGEVVRLEPSSKFPIPHVGWNNLEILNENVIFCDIESNKHFYFDHSYHVICDEDNVVATAQYKIKINATINKNNIFGVQFHPEKSDAGGLAIFKNFMQSIDKC